MSKQYNLVADQYDMSFQLSPAGAEQYGAETFAGSLRQPHAVLIECVKQ